MTERRDTELENYLAISRKRGVAPRCPFASVYRCPRYYASLSLLGMAGNTSIDPALDERLLQQWRSTDLWPVTREQETSVAGPPGSPRHFINFCPEVAYDNFGVFASSLHRHADEIDTDTAHRNLAEDGAAPDDWRWQWAHISPMHYTTCPLYSPLLSGVSATATKQRIGF